MSDIVFRVVIDDNGVPAAAGRTEAGFQRMGAAADKSAKAMGVSAAQTANAWKMVPLQLQDAAVQLQGGTGFATVLLQQGTQVVGSFGGIREAGRAMLSVLTPARLVFGGLAVAAGGLAVAIYQGREESIKFERQLATNGFAAGVLRGQVDQMAKSLGDMPGNSIGPAREALQTLAASGEFVGATLESAGRATLALKRITGESVDKITASFAGARDGVAAWASTQNRAYNFLTAAQIEYIKQLELQGRQQEAMRFAFNELAGTMESRVAPSIGTLEKALEGATKVWDTFWNAAKGIGKAETVEERIASLQDKLDKARSFKPAPGGYFGNDRSAAAQTAANDKTVSQLEEELRMYAKEGAIRSNRTADKAAAAQAEREKEIRNSKAYNDTMLALEASRWQATIAQELFATDKLRITADESYRRREISAQAYTDAIIASERQRVGAQVQLAAQAAEAERKRKVEVQKGELPEQADARKKTAVNQAEARLTEAMRQQRQVEARIRANEFRVTPDAGVETRTSSFRQTELQQYAESERFMTERRLASQASARELVQTNRETSVSLIQDDRLRGLAQIDLEQEQLRKRLDLTALSVEDRKAAEEEFAQWRVLREKQLTDQLKPQWQRDVELWADTTRDMKARFDTFNSGFVDAGRTAWQQWAQDGRFSTSSLVNFIKSEFSRMAYERFLASYVQKAGSWLFNTLLGSGTGGGSGMPDDVPTRGGKANGGGVPGNSAWLVGERGPEVLVMGRNPGVVVPNDALRTAAGSGAVNITQQFNVRGNEDLATMYKLAAMARDSAMAGVAEARRRGSPAFVGG